MMQTTIPTDSVEQLYRATTRPRLVNVPALPFLCIDGHGDPNTSHSYVESVQGLFSVSYAAKFALKKSTGVSFRVSPLETLWWAEDMTTFLSGDKDDWDWTAMVRQPDTVTEDLVERLTAEVAARKNLPVLHDLRLVTLEEGPAAQVLHVGPYAAEGPTIERLHGFIADQGLVFDGHHQKHHEIYLGDPRRAAPDKLRTIIRQPCSPPLTRGQHPLTLG
jgi:hypothetical protein